MALLPLIGCVRQEDLDREFQANREAAYQQLVRAHRDPNAAEATTSDLEIAQGPLSLRDAIEIALVHNKDVQAAHIQLLEAKGQMTEAVSTALPKASFSGQALRNDNEGFITNKETYSLGVSGRQPLYLGGLTGAALDAAASYTYFTGQQLRQTLQTVERQVRQQYLDALLARELVNVAEQARLDAQRSLNDAETKLRYGAGTRFDVLRAQVRVNSVNADLIQVRNAADVARTRLLNTLGVSQLSDVTLVDSLAYEPIDGPGEGSLFRAIKSRPELLMGEAQIRLARDNVQAEQAGDRPKVYLQGMYQESYPGFSSSFSSFAAGGADGGTDGGDATPAAARSSAAPAPAADEGDDGNGGGFDLGSFGGGREWERTANAGIVVEWPFFDGFRTAGRVAQAKAAVRRQEVGLKKAEQQVQFEVKQALLTLESSRQFVESQLGNVTTAEESLRLSRVRYREGTGTSLDVISAETALAQARADYLRSVRDYEASKVQLAWSLGVLGEEELTQATGQTGEELESQINTD